MQQYLDTMRLVLEKGRKKDDRTNTGTIAYFGHQYRCDLSAGFPLLTTKKLHLKSIIHELLWFLRGSTDARELQALGVTIWDSWQAPEPFRKHEGDLGPVYGEQWRSWKAPDGTEIDQISNLIHDLRTNPTSRRHIVTAWNPADIKKVALAWCHCLFQFYCEELTLEERLALGAMRKEWDHENLPSVSHEALDAARIPKHRLSCQLYQRSADLLLGVPFNTASYSLLTMMIAQCVNMVPGDFIHTFGDVHIYSNHMEQVELQLSREPRALPTMRLNPEVKDIFGFKFEDFTLEGYDNPHPSIKAPVAV